MSWKLRDRKRYLRTFFALFLYFALLSLVPLQLFAEGPLRIYVLRTGDDASDLAVVQALTERGHTVDLGVRANQLDFASISLSSYHVVVALGVPVQTITRTGINVLAKYLNQSGALVVDGEMTYQLPTDAITTLHLPASYCGRISHPTAVTTFTAVDPPDPVIHNGIPSSFDVPLTSLTDAGSATPRMEICLIAQAGARSLFTSKGAEETRTRIGLASADPSSTSRTVSFAVALRSRELQNPDFARTFVNSVEWAGAHSVPSPADTMDRASTQLRLYVLRTGDDAADQSVVQALRERGHTVDLGVRANQLDAATVRLSDYHAVVALGVPGQILTTTAVATLAKYLNQSGGVFTDGEMVYDMPSGAGATLQLPGEYCGRWSFPNSQVSLKRIEPSDPTLAAGIPASFDLSLTPLSDPGQSTARVGMCLLPTGGARLFIYARQTDDALALPGVVGKEIGPKSRTISFAPTIRSRELQNPNFRRLFVNGVEWVAANSEPSVPEKPRLSSKPLRIYVFRTGEDASDKSVSAVLAERGHSVTLGVRANQLEMAPPLTGFDAVVGLGVPGQGISAVGADVLSKYLQSSGRLILDGEFVYEMGSLAGSLRLPATYCGKLAGDDPNTIFQRVDPPDPLIHRNIPASFSLPLSVLRDPGQSNARIEHCIIPSTNGKILFYSVRKGETVPRPGLLVNEPQLKSRAAVFSVTIRNQELQSPNFRAAFVNTVEWAAEQLADPIPFDVGPTQLSFVFNSSADSARSQTLLVTPATLTPAVFAVTTFTTSGEDWLRVTPNRATTPASLTVQASPVFLAPGLYQGEVVVTSGSSVVHVPVKAVVNSTAPCTYDISPLRAVFAAAGGSEKIGVSAPPGCSWTAASALPWVTISAGATGTGPGTVVYSVAPAATAEARSGGITVAGQTFRVTETGTSLSFRLDPAALTFRLAENSSQPDTRALSVISSLAASFTASATGGTWLSVAPASGAAPGTMIVSATAAGLAPGTYQGSIVIGIPTATPAEQSIAVSLTIDPANATPLRVEPTSLTLSAAQGGDVKTNTLQVTNPGRGTLVFRAVVDDGSFLSITPDSGTVAPGLQQSITISGNPQGLAAGSYSGHVTVSASTGEKVTVRVVLTVSAINQTILLSQTGLSYMAVSLGGKVLPQTFSVLNIGAGVMDWTAAASTLSGESWLSLTRGSGSADAAALVPLPIDVNVDATNLRPGDYRGRITVTSPTASNSPQIMSVLLRVLPPGSNPGPMVRPTGLIFITPLSGSAGSSSQDVMVSNITSDVRTFNSSRLTTDNITWFTHTPVQSSVAPGQPTRVTVQASSAGLTSGVRRGVLTLLFDDGAVQNVNVLSIVPPQASTLSKTVREAASCADQRLVLTSRTLQQNFAALAGEGVAIDVKAADRCGNLLIPQKGASASVTATFSNGDTRLNLSHVGNGIWTGTWRPVTVSSSVVVTLTAFNFEGISTFQAEQIELSGSIRDAGRTPIVTAGGLLNAASFAAGVPIAPGSLITVYGTNLADDSAVSDKLPLPREVNGVEVLLGDRSLPLLYISKNQLNVQVPFGLSANTQQQISVRRGEELSVPESVTVADSVPGIFTKNSSGSGQGVITKNGEAGLVEPGNPAKSGDYIVIYCTGLGAVTPSVDSGSASPGTNPATVPGTIELRIGGKVTQTLFVGLTAGAVGLYQINAVVPDGVAPSDAVPVTITAGGQTSPPVTMAIQ